MSGTIRVVMRTLELVDDKYTWSDLLELPDSPCLPELGHQVQADGVEYWVHRVTWVVPEKEDEDVYVEVRVMTGPQWLQRTRTRRREVV